MERAKREKGDGSRWAKTERRTEKSETSAGIERRRTRSIENPSAKSMCGYRESAICDSMVPAIGVASARKSLGWKVARSV